MNTPKDHPIKNHTQQLAKFCASIHYEDLPESVVHKAKLCILDYVANVYGSLELEAVQQVAVYVKSIHENGNASVFGWDFKTDIHHAAFVNGTTAEAIEAQDGVRFGGNHPGVSVIPAAFAMAEDQKADGKKMIEAIAAGYEAAARIAAAMHPWHTLGGFLPTGTCGTFGAAAAAGRLLNLDPDAMAAAFGNAGFTLPISTAETLMGGHTAKIVQGGQSASTGLMAAGLAKQGIFWAPYIIEGSKLNAGFAQITTAADPDLTRLTKDLGQAWAIEDVYFKPYTACRHTHGAAQATLAMARANRIHLDAIESVTVFSYGIAELAVGKQVRQGDSFVSAQFSIPFVVAVCLFDNELGPEQLTEKRLRDPELMAFSQRVRVCTDEALNAVYPEKTSSRVEIEFKDGSKISNQVDIPKGDPRDPMDAAAIIEKIKQFAREVKTKDEIDQIAETILDLEQSGHIQDLTLKI
ncbi:MAG: MmgE/PrpD family protein [Desulfobacter sp.]|nr:MmgE/PrpD family protein [Desulfobacter sp.]